LLFHLFKTKDEALNCFKIYKAKLENQLEKKIKRFSSDQGGDYFSNELDLFCIEHSIIHERTLPYSTQSNGVVERKNHTLTDLFNCMLDTAGLSKTWWEGPLLTSCHILNIVPMQNKEKTPYEEWIGSTPSLSYLRTWGCLAKVNVSINKRRKLGPKIVDCIFLGYVHHSIAYRFLVIKPEVPDVYVDTFLESRDITFFENIFPMKNSHSISRLPKNVIADTTSEPSKFFCILNIHLDQSMRRLMVKLLEGARDRGLQSLLVVISWLISWMTLLELFQRHLHLQM
jgi:hypothetical protein